MMRLLLAAAILLLVGMGGGASADTWQSDSDIIGGLADVGTYSAPSGVFNGYHWTGSTWTSDSGIISGLADVGFHSTPDVFNIGGTWYLLTGSYQVGFDGYHWTGSTWTSDSGIISGLAGGYALHPIAFQKDSIWYMVVGDYYGTFTGYNWTGSTWQSDSAIASGLGDVGLWSSPTTFQKGTTWYLITGEQDGVFTGFNWTGLTWQSDSAIASGLADVGIYSALDVFNMGGTEYLIAGEQTGVFNGYTPPSCVPTNLTYTLGAYWVNHTWDNGDMVADSYNVSINGTWHNGTTVTYYNNTLTANYQWSNITVYGFSNTGGLSAGYVSENVQLHTFIPPTPLLVDTEWGFYWANRTWSEGSQNETYNGDTDSYNVSVNGTWYNDTVTTQYNHTVGSVGWSNITIYAFNNSGGLSDTPLTENTHVSICNCGVDTQGEWVSYPGIVNLLGDVGAFASPTVFEMDDMWYCISGEGDYYLTGWEWWEAEEQWKAPAINVIGGLWTQRFTHSTVFLINDTRHLISGHEFGTFYGYYWNGNSWVEDSNVVKGLYDVGSDSAPTVFDYYGTPCLITGMWTSGSLDAYWWNGSGWSYDPSIATGIVGKQDSVPTIFNIDGINYCIVGSYSAVDGYCWNGETWEQHFNVTGIVAGVGASVAPTVFQKDGTWYLITGHDDGTFKGYVWCSQTHIVLRDKAQNLVKNAKVSVYDKTNSTYIHKWQADDDGITTVDTWDHLAHDLTVCVKTFDGVFVYDLSLGEYGKIINLSVPLNYNLKIYSEDQHGVPLTRVFAGLAEYTPLNPGAFWGMDLSDRGYVPVTNCSGFAMCDIIAEKEGYVDFRVEALNWTSKSALVKDYRHNIVMEEE
jgi:hypothetical protein